MLKTTGMMPHITAAEREKTAFELECPDKSIKCFCSGAKNADDTNLDAPWRSVSKRATLGSRACVMTRRLSPVGLCCALLALAIQFSFGVAGGAFTGPAGSVPSPLGAGQQEIAVLSALLPGAGILCHSDGDAPSQVPETPGPRHSHGDCAICPLCVPMAQPIAASPASQELPPPSVVTVRMAAPPPQATAPPIPRFASARPRAPPALT